MPINHEDGLFGIDYWLDPESEEAADQEEFGDSAQEIRERALKVLKAGKYKYASLSRWEDGEYVEFEALTLDDLESM